METLPVEISLKVIKDLDIAGISKYAQTSKAAGHVAHIAINDRCQKFGIPLGLSYTDKLARLKYLEDLTGYNGDIVTIVGFAPLWRHKQILDMVIKTGDVNTVVETSIRDNGPVVLYAAASLNYELAYILLLMGANANSMTSRFKDNMISIQPGTDIDPHISALALAFGLDPDMTSIEIDDGGIFDGDSVYQILATSPDALAAILALVGMPVRNTLSDNMDELENYIKVGAGDMPPLPTGWPL